MSDRDRRGLWLTLFAVLNLACWIGGAIVAGLIVGERLDLGVETLIRQGQATAESAWGQVSERVARRTATPAIPGPSTVPPDAEPIGTSPTAAVAEPTPLRSSSTPEPGVTSAPASSSTPEPGATPAPASTTTGDAVAPTAEPSPEPEVTLVSSPLLLADPQISDLSKLDAEMSLSAPDRAVQIRYQEETLNREIAALWKNNPELPYRDVTVDMQRGRVAVTGRVTVLGFAVEATLLGKVTAKDCVPVLEVESLAVAGIMTPRFVKDQVQEMAFEAMTWYPEDYALCLEEIVLEETGATVYGYRR